MCRMRLHTFISGRVGAILEEDTTAREEGAEYGMIMPDLEDGILVANEREDQRGICQALYGNILKINRECIEAIQITGTKEA
jgi:hypothetical protein